MQQANQKQVKKEQAKSPSSDGLNLNSVFVINKAIGPSSFSVVQAVKRRRHAQKAGHMGTLDPFAEGVLPVFVNKATHLLPYIEDQSKTYLALVAVGVATDTYDVTGKVTKYAPLTASQIADLTKNEAALIRETLNSLLGTQKQAIPLYSAKKVAGKKLYEYARLGQTVEPQYKTIEVENVKLKAWYPQALAKSEAVAPKAEPATKVVAKVEVAQKARVELEPQLQAQLGLEHPAWAYRAILPPSPRPFSEDNLNSQASMNNLASWQGSLPQLYLVVEFKVSKGAFIRALVNELGQRLGTAACTLRLIRTQAGPFSLEQAVLETALNEQTPSLNLAKIFQAWPFLDLETAWLKALTRGQVLTFCPKNDAKQQLFSTELLVKKLRNFDVSSIMKDKLLIVATYLGKVVGILNLELKVSQQIASTLTESSLDTSSLLHQTSEILSQASLTLSVERMLISHEDL